MQGGLTTFVRGCSAVKLLAPRFLDLRTEGLVKSLAQKLYE
jgi:hypothetical protein